MKKLLILLLLSLSFNSYGEYTKVNENVEDDSYYIDFQTLRPVDDDYVVWWEMRDLAKSRDGYMSSQIYYKGDCVQTRTKLLSIIQYTGSMATGQSEDISGGFVNLEDIMGHCVKHFGGWVKKNFCWKDNDEALLIYWKGVNAYTDSQLTVVRELAKEFDLKYAERNTSSLIGI